MLDKICYLNNIQSIIIRIEKLELLARILAQTTIEEIIPDSPLEYLALTFKSPDIEGAAYKMPVDKYLWFPFFNPKES